MPLPKVLVIGQPFSNDTGGGVTLCNLFSGWNRDKLAVACSGYLLSNYIDASICNTYYQLGDKEYRWIFPFNFIKSKNYSGLIKLGDKKNIDLKIKKSKLRVKIIMNYFFPFLEFFGLLHCISKSVLSHEFRAWVKEYDPDIIYAQAALRQDLLFCMQTLSFLKKPFIFHMMDDWPSTISNSGLFKTFWHKKIDKELRALLDESTVLMSISETMSEEYKNRYGKDFIPFHNPVNIQFWKKYQKSNYDLSDQPEIIYAGRIGLGVENSLETIAKAVEKVNEDPGLFIKFVLYTEQKPSWIKKYPCAEVRGYIPYEQIPKTFSEGDFLILPYDFSKKSIKYIQYSMPTKGPEYMMSGTPIILFAPVETAIVKYCQKFNCAKIITENKVNILSKALSDLILNKTERQQIGENAKKIAEEKHNSIKVIRNFKEIICSLTFKEAETINA